MLFLPCWVPCMDGFFEEGACVNGNCFPRERFILRWMEDYIAVKYGVAGCLWAFF